MSQQYTWLTNDGKLCCPVCFCIPCYYNPGDLLNCLNITDIILLILWFLLGIVNTTSAREDADFAIGIIMLILCILTIIFSFWILCTLKKSIREGTLKGKATAWILTRSIFHGVYVIIWLVLIIIIASFLGKHGSAADAFITILIAIFAIPLLVSLYLLCLSIFVSFNCDLLGLESS